MVDPHWSNLCASITSSAQHQSERFALILLKEDQFVEKNFDSDKKKFFRSLLKDLLSSAAVSHTWDDTNVSVSQAGQNGSALVNSTCVRDSCSSGELLQIYRSNTFLWSHGSIQLIMYNLGGLN